MNTLNHKCNGISVKIRKKGEQDIYMHRLDLGKHHNTFQALC